MVSAPPRIIIATPIGSEIPPRCTGTCSCRCADNSRNQTLNLANTKPRLMTATLVLIQARKVRSLARYSVAPFRFIYRRALFLLFHLQVFEKVRTAATGDGNQTLRCRLLRQ